MLEEYAPFLASLGPSVLVPPLILLVAYLYLTRNPAQSRKNFKPKDEDDYVFLDKTELPPQVEENDHPMQYSEEDAPHISYQPDRYSEEEMLARSESFYKLMNKRRSCRFFSPEPVPMKVVENIIHTAG